MTSATNEGADNQRLWFIGLAVTVAISALTSLVLLGIGIGKGAEWISAAFTVYSAVVAAIALAGAAAAFYIAYIPYRRWIAEQARRPSITLWAAVDRGGDQPADRIEAETSVPGHDVDLKVVVQNDGDAPVCGGILNVVVPAECSLEVVDPGSSNHRVMRGVHHNAEINEDPGAPPRHVRFSTVERDFTPNHFIYWVHIRTPGPMRCPVLLALDGDPPQHARMLVNITTAGWTAEP